MSENREPSEHCINREWCKRSGQCDHWLTHLEGCEAAAWSKAHDGISAFHYWNLPEKEREAIKNGIK